MNTNKLLFIAITIVLATTLITSTIVAIEPAQAKKSGKSCPQHGCKGIIKNNNLGVASS